MHRQRSRSCSQLPRAETAFTPCRSLSTPWLACSYGHLAVARVHVENECCSLMPPEVEGSHWTERYRKNREQYEDYECKKENERKRISANGDGIVMQDDSVISSTVAQRTRKLGTNLSDAEMYLELMNRSASFNLKENCAEQIGPTRMRPTSTDTFHRTVLRNCSSSDARGKADSHRHLRIERWLYDRGSKVNGWWESEIGGSGGNETRAHQPSKLRVPHAVSKLREISKMRSKSAADYVHGRRLSTAAKSRRDQWLTAISTSSISSETSCCDDIPVDHDSKDPVEKSERKECSLKLIHESRLNALKDKLSSKGQSFELIDLLATKNERELLALIQSTHTRVVLDVCLLWACIQDDSSLVNHFLSLGAAPEAADAEGFNALHLAAENSSSETIKILIAAGAKVVGPTVWDNKKEVTPVMLAVRAGNLSTLTALIEAGADVNAGLNTRREVALHYAVRANSIECVRALLAASAVPNPLTLYSETPLHIAVGEGYTDLVAILLAAGADVRASRDTARMTALHIAAQEGRGGITKLLLDAGADHKQKNSRGQTALHLAAQSQSPDTVQELLRKEADPNAKDNDGKTPLHAGIFKGSRSFECLKLLVEANADPNAADCAGYTPLHLAALHDSSYCVQMFLKRGGDVSARTRGGISALNIILRKTPIGLTCLQEILDSSVSHYDRDQHHDPETQMQLDFRIFRGEKGREPECRLLTCFIKEGQKHLLKHPLCESFLYLKWQQVRAFFIINLIFYSILVLSLTTFILLTFPGSSFCDFFITKTTNPFGASFRVNVASSRSEKETANRNINTATLNISDVSVNAISNRFYPEDVVTSTQSRLDKLGKKSCATVINIRFSRNKPVVKPSSDIEKCHKTKGFIVIKHILLYLIWIFTLILTLKELIQFLDTPRTYISTLDNLLVWPIIIFTFMLTLVGLERVHRNDWEHHVAAVLILISWIELLLLVGRFPLFGLYVQMFAQVTRNFGKFLFAYMCLITAFSLSFGVLFHNHDSFKYYLLRLLKTLVMMTGELEYDQFFFESEEIRYPGTSHVIFAMFLIFGTIILMNLLVGLAVSDIQGLQQSAGLDRLVRQTQLIASLEMIIFSSWLSFTTPSTLLRIIRNRVLLLPSLYGGILTVIPKKMESFRLSAEIVESLQKVAQSLDHGSRRRNAFANFRSMSQAAHYGGGLEGETARGIEAVHCGIELLVRDSDDRKIEAKHIKESVLAIICQLQDIQSHIKDPSKKENKPLTLSESLQSILSE